MTATSKRREEFKEHAIRFPHLTDANSLTRLGVLREDRAGEDHALMEGGAILGSLEVE